MPAGTKISAAILAVALITGCARTYAVHNGGLTSVQAPAGAAELKPSEAAGQYSTDYAPPEKNVTYGGPTNRVATRVPLQPEPHPFVAVYVSTAAKGVEVVQPAAESKSQDRVDIRKESTESKTISDSNAASHLSAPIQEAALRGTDGIDADKYAAAKVRTDHRASLQAPEETHAAAAKATASNSQGLADSAAFQENSVPSGAMDAASAKSAGGLTKSAANSTVTLPLGVSESIDNTAPKEHADTVVSQGMTTAQRTLEAAERRATTRGTGSTAAASRTASDAAATRIEANAVKLDAQRLAISEIGDSEYLISETKAEGIHVYKRCNAKVTLVGKRAARGTVSSDAAAVREAPGNIQSIGAAESPIERTHAAGTLDASAAKGVEAQSQHLEIKEGTWTSAARSEVQVLPPTLSILKEARLITGGGIDRLVEKKILREKPSANAVICYRICVFNESESAAADVKVTDRLDSRTTLLENSVFTSSDAAEVKYDSSTKALEVTLPHLEGYEIFFIEFYVQPSQKE